MAVLLRLLALFFNLFEPLFRLGQRVLGNSRIGWLFVGPNLLVFGLFTLVLARDLAQAEELDELLWSFDAEAYIPHQIAGEDMDEEEAMVLIAVPGGMEPARPLVINLRDDTYLGACDRILEVVPADASAREPLRERWKQYKALGFDVNKYDM